MFPAMGGASFCGLAGLSTTKPEAKNVGDALRERTVVFPQSFAETPSGLRLRSVVAASMIARDARQADQRLLILIAELLPAALFGHLRVPNGSASSSPRVPDGPRFVLTYAHSGKD